MSDEKRTLDRTAILVGGNGDIFRRDPIIVSDYWFHQQRRFRLAGTARGEPDPKTHIAPETFVYIEEPRS